MSAEQKPIRPDMPKAFLAKCFPDLQQRHGQRQQVQLRVAVNAQPGADSTPTGATGRAGVIACMPMLLFDGRCFHACAPLVLLRKHWWLLHPYAPFPPMSLSFAPDWGSDSLVEWNLYRNLTYCRWR